MADEDGLGGSGQAAKQSQTSSSGSGSGVTRIAQEQSDGVMSDQ